MMERVHLQCIQLQLLCDGFSQKGQFLLALCISYQSIILLATSLF